MYAVTLRKKEDGSQILIYDDILSVNGINAVDPVLVREINSAGSLTITLPTVNNGYDLAESPDYEYVVYREDESKQKKEIWRGRAVLVDTDFWNNKKITCEGELAYFNDTIQPNNEWTNKTVEQYLSYLLSAHNEKLDSVDKFHLGHVTFGANQETYWYTDFNNTLTYLTDVLLQYHGGFFYLRHSSTGTRYLDYYMSYDDYDTIIREGKNTNQQIRYASNMIDVSKQLDRGDIYTAVIPLGAVKDTSPYLLLDDYYTVESVSPDGIYVLNNDAIALYGRKETVIHYDEETNASKLYNKGVKFLNDIQFDSIAFEVTAFDLHYTDLSIDAIDLFDRVPIISKPHNLNKIVPVTRVETPLNEPSKSKIVLNGSTKGKKKKISYIAVKSNKKNK